MNYTVDAGRQILRDGIRVATVYSKVQTGEKDGLPPVEADQFTHEIARKLNAWPLMLAALERIIQDGGYDDDGDFFLCHQETPDKDKDYLDPEAIEMTRAAIQAATSTREQWRPATK